MSRKAPLTRSGITEWAATLARARRDRVGCEPITSSVDLTIDDAYAIQRAGTAIRLERGEKVIGWKLGYTSLAMRAQMGIDQPNFGPLTDAMLVADHGAAGAALMQPRVEPEIGLRFHRSVSADANLDEVLSAVGAAFACLEIVDSVYPNYQFRLEDNTADGSSAAQVVVGPALTSIEHLDDITVVLLHNGVESGSATGRAASGHPAAGVVWLVRQLALQGRTIEADQIVITGGLTRAVPLDFGDRVEALFDDHTQVSVYRPPRAPSASDEADSAKAGCDINSVAGGLCRSHE
ncbi:MAG TPA: fumarylacetoacetate hydrolase family protein [Ilumatobacteraceae bacterium]|nr:fumarylacetoacetate hydrolase family protein [Ilumatobacteraceae bacterium]